MGNIIRITNSVRPNVFNLRYPNRHTDGLFRSALASMRDICSESALTPVVARPGVCDNPKITLSSYTSLDVDVHRLQNTVRGAFLSWIGNSFGQHRDTRGNRGFHELEYVGSITYCLFW